MTACSYRLIVMIDSPGYFRIDREGLCFSYFISKNILFNITLNKIRQQAKTYTKVEYIKFLYNLGYRKDANEKKKLKF